MTSPPSSSKVEELVRRLQEESCRYTSKQCPTCVKEKPRIRSAVLAALELAAERLWYAQERTAWEIVRSLSIPSEKPREEP